MANSTTLPARGGALPRGGGMPRGGGIPTITPPGPVAPGRRPRLWWLALLLIPLLALLGWWWTNPGSLDETALVGARGPGCVRLVIAADVSGSMTKLAKPRDEAITKLLAWAPANLRPDDEIALVTFGTDSAIVIPPTRVDAPPVRTDIAVPAGSTNLAPLVNAIDSLPPTRCRTALLLIGDGQFGDLPGDEATATAQLAGARVDTLDFLVPGRTDIPKQWKTIYPSAPPQFFDGNNPDETALTFGRRLAHLTGQQLTRTTN